MKIKNENKKSPYATLSAESIRVKKGNNASSKPTRAISGDLRAKEGCNPWKKTI